MRRDLLSELESLVSEERNPRTEDIDLLPTRELLARMNEEDARVPAAVAAVLPQISEAVERITNAFRVGGRLIYIGAGTSGRLGILDASECPPTFGVPEGMVVGLIAGGDHALRHAMEGAEDEVESARNDLDRIGVSDRDVVVGISVSGRTPYVLGALKEGRQRGAATVSISCNPGSAADALADIAIAPVVGPEVLTGSTRLKSGTAQKLVLNMLTTASMIRIGKAYGNLMVDLRVTNDKLAARATRIVMQATGCSMADAEAALEASQQEVKLAILMLLTGDDARAARARLDAAGGVLRSALQLTKSLNER
ncbi:N-acetylmuramic acid 6-phosphate etherase [Solirhodobacter olei]|uniref:N-acetylmuramic acid 6-phosphate etherase n=1 Tax=Solirhodobacter olei TaxID=2493082 RepID=UPI000FD9E5A9|nr:N-acetylmuramic acid 6-phosphate etherase [Solirhodobacter olei]